MSNFLQTTVRNIAWFNKTHNDGELDMKPPFQRNPVWVDKQKSFLIDTILNGFPIPEIYMQETVTASGKSKYIVVDGQQRIRSVLEFIEGKFSMNGKDSPDYADMRFDDLAKEQKKLLYQYNFIIRTLPEIPDVELREIFQRLNKNVIALNAQELRNATYWGPFISTMNELADKEIWSRLGLFTPNDIRRMLDVEYISELSIGILYGTQNKKDNLDKYYQLYEEEFEELSFVKNSFDSIIGEILKIIPDIVKTRWSKKSDFYTLFLVFSNHIEEVPLSKESRKNACEILINFGNDIDYYIKNIKEDFVEEIPDENVKTYYKGSRRATTDLGSRNSRAKALENMLKKVW